MRWLMLCSLLTACEGASTSSADDGGRPDSQAPDAVLDAAARAPDGAALDGALPDATPALDGAPRVDGAADATPRDGAPLDATPDAAPLDAAPPDAMLPPVVDAVLTLEPELAAFDEVGGFRLLDPGASVTVAVALPPELAALPAVALVVDAQVWRFEDGEVELDLGAGPTPALLPGDGRGLPVTLRHREAGEVPGPAGDFPVFLIPSEGLRTLTLTARGGVLGLAALRVMDPRRALPEPLTPHPEDGPIPYVEVAAAPCGEGCDDGAALSALVAAADPAEPLRITLAAGRFSLRTPITIRRSDVVLQGAGRENTLLFWDPIAEAPRGAVLITGRGRLGGAVPTRAEVSGLRRFPLAQVWPAAAHARITSDDFGEIPPTCANGRDQEQRQRHLGQLVRVLGEGAETLVVDRPLNLAIPAAANARLEPVELIQRAAVRDLTLEAHCPEALVNPTFARPACPNAFVQGDAAVLMEWVEGGTVAGVEARGFGKFSVELSNTLDARVFDYRMHHPSDYGEGGAGYGVHLITASRTVVHDVEVEHARHGVVIDFGSSDSQVLTSRLADMPQALIDVHGEASRDSLIRGNSLQNAQLGIIVGGGGGFAHCNDGPRHHLLHNTLEGITNSGITLFFESRQVFIRHNQVQGNLFGLTVAFDSGEVLAERNVFTGTRIPVQLAGGGPVVVRGNAFLEVCSADRAAMALGGELVVEPDNVYCP